jgi:hypothetical protein
MTTTEPHSLSARDRALLRAINAGRCRLDDDCEPSLVVDGVCCCDQFAVLRLIADGLIATDGPRPGPARLTKTGRALITAA